MEDPPKHVRSHSLKCRSNCNPECETESSSFDLHGRRQSTGSSHNRKLFGNLTIFGQKTLRPNLNLGRVHENEQDDVFDGESGSQLSSGPKFPTTFYHRPGSYLHRSMSEHGRRFSHHSYSSSVGTDDGRSEDSCDTCVCKKCMCENCKCMEIVTPFAQVLAKLHSVRENLEHVLNVFSEQGIDFTKSLLKPDVEDTDTNTISPNEQPYLSNSMDSLANLDWCLCQLERLCSHQSVADMTRQKFSNLLAQEITKLSTSKSGNEISEFILNTYTESSKPNHLILRRGINRNQSAPNLMCASPHKLLAQKSINRDTKSFTIDWALKQSDVILDESYTVPKHGVFTTQEEKLGTHLNKIHSWGLDIFHLYDLSKGFPLTAAAFKIFRERNILQEFHIHPTTFINYFTSLEKNYLQVPYHSSKHAADVMQSSHVLLNLPTLKSLFSPYDITAALFAAAVHDVGHPGVTNQYLINTGSDLALLYNDNSVLENYHVSLAFKLAQNPQRDIFWNLSSDERKVMRRMIIDIVLATDMTKHIIILADMQTMMETRNLTGIESDTI